MLDADIYGPSLPKLLAIKEKPEIGRHAAQAHRALWPHGDVDRLPDRRGDADDLARADGDAAITQMLREVEWGELDILVVDMPPGTGDAQLTMAQQVPLAGAVIVSTPQDLALIDARQGIAMFRRVKVPVLGIVENMSYFICPHCGERSDIFGHGGARKEAGGSTCRSSAKCRWTWRSAKRRTRACRWWRRSPTARTRKSIARSPPRCATSCRAGPRGAEDRDRGVIHLHVRRTSRRPWIGEILP